PVASTMPFCPDSSTSSSDSRRRNPASPSISKIVATLAPVRSSTAASRSMHGIPKCSASRRPMLDLPAPIGPIRNRLAEGFMRPLLQHLQPAPLVFRAPVEQAEEQLLDPARHGAAFAAADLLAVDRTDRRDLGGGAAHKDLVGEVKVFARQVALDHGDAG